MSINKLFSWISPRGTAKSAETISYDSLFKGSAVAASGAFGNYLPGLRAVDNEVDTYFKDVFAGPVF